MFRLNHSGKVDPKKLIKCKPARRFFVKQRTLHVPWAYMFEVCHECNTWACTAITTEAIDVYTTARWGGTLNVSQNIDRMANGSEKAIPCVTPAAILWNMKAMRPLTGRVMAGCSWFNRTLLLSNAWFAINGWATCLGQELKKWCSCASRCTAYSLGTWTRRFFWLAFTSHQLMVIALAGAAFLEWQCLAPSNRKLFWLETIECCLPYLSYPSSLSPILSLLAFHPPRQWMWRVLLLPLC